MNSPQLDIKRELFFVLQNLSRRFHHFLTELGPIAHSLSTQSISAVQTYYEKNSDVALLSVSFSSDFLRKESQNQCIELASKGGIPVLDPRRLNSKDKTLFYKEYLKQFNSFDCKDNDASESLRRLGVGLGLLNNSAEEHSVHKKDPSGKGRFCPDSDTHLCVGPTTTQLVDLESNTAVELPVQDLEVSDDDSLTKENYFPKGCDGKEKAMGAIDVSQEQAHVPSVANEEERIGRRNRLPSPNLIPRVSLRAKTTTMPVKEEKLVADVRYQRGDQWNIARLRNLTTRGVRLASSMAPPLGAAIRVWIQLGGYTTSLIGTVVEATSNENSEDGTTTFRMLFGDNGQEQKNGLVNLLRLAKRKGLSLTPPPARKSRRFALNWPLSITHGNQVFIGSALDISQGGFFVATDQDLLEEQLIFEFSVDQQNLMIRGRASIVRQVDERMAAERRIIQGYGMQVEDLSQHDDLLFRQFLQRVQRRAQKHILIAGSGAHTRAMANSFQSAGYVVSQACSIKDMLQRSQFENCPPDVAVLDQDVLSRTLRNQFEATFRDNQVPMLALHLQEPSLARQKLDRMVSV